MVAAGLFLLAIFLVVVLVLWGIHFYFLYKSKSPDKKVLKVIYSMTNNKDSKVSIFQLLYKTKMDITSFNTLIKRFENDGIIVRKGEKVSFTSFGKKYYDSIINRKGK